MTIYLINISITIMRVMMIITKRTRIPLKMPIMLPKPADGSVSSCVLVTDGVSGLEAGVSGHEAQVVESVATTTPVKGHMRSALSLLIMVKNIH